MKQWIDKELPILFLAALLFRLLWLFAVMLLNQGDAFLLYDSYSYLNLADNLVKFGELVRVGEDGIFKEHWWPPGFPVFLGLFRILNLSLVDVVIVQSLLSAFSVCLLFLSAKALGSPRKTAFLVSFFLAIDLPSIIFASAVLSDTIFVFLMLLGLYLLLKTHDRAMQKIPLAIVAGLVLSLAILVRPVGVLLPLAFLLFLLFKREYKTGIVFLLASYLLVFCWMWRNQQVFGIPFVSTVGNWNLLLYRAAETQSVAKQISLVEARAQLMEKLLEETEKKASPDDFEASIREGLKAARVLSLEVILKHKWLFVRNSLQNAFLVTIKPARSYIDLMLFGKETRENEKISLVASSFVGFQLLHLALAWLLFAAGIVYLIRKRKSKILLPLLFAIVYLLLASAGPEGDARFRMPIVPLALLLGSFARLPRLRGKPLLLKFEGAKRAIF